MSNGKIKWGCIQPLTGGMYLGAEKAIGHPAEWIITYPGLADEIKDKSGKVIDAVNERNLVEYLKKHNRLPGYYMMNREYLNAKEMMCDVDFDVKYTLDGQSATPDISNMDVVVAVPVCAGLSMASIANADRKAQCNCQMVWMAKYAMKVIKPKVYIFENAPTLMSSRGDEVRDQLETIAMENGYSTVYYKTDTKLHHNCQKRPRTFIMFFKNRDGERFVPDLHYENDRLTVKEFFNEMPAARANDPMNVTLDNHLCVDIPLAWCNYKWGKCWRKYVAGDLIDPMCHDHELRAEFMGWLKNSDFTENDYNWYVKHFDHVDDKVSQGLDWWSTAAKYFKDGTVPACMYKNVSVTIHHDEDRLYNMREWLYAMGHPCDFDMIGDAWNYFRKMGQNVPARTAQWIVSEAVRIIKNWENEPNVAKENQGAAFFDNTKQKRIW